MADRTKPRRLEYLPLDDLQPDPRNPKAQAFDRIAELAGAAD